MVSRACVCGQRIADSAEWGVWTRAHRLRRTFLVVRMHVRVWVVLMVGVGMGVVARGGEVAMDPVHHEVLAVLGFFGKRWQGMMLLLVRMRWVEVLRLPLGARLVALAADAPLAVLDFRFGLRRCGVIARQQRCGNRAPNLGDKVGTPGQRRT